MSLFETLILKKIADRIGSGVDNNALCIDGCFYTYKTLSERISTIRVGVRNYGGQHSIYAIAIHDDIDTYAAIFALWMEGKAYVPLHPAQPLERNLGILKQASVTVVIDSKDRSVFDGKVEKVIHTSNMVFERMYLEDWRPVSDDELAYVLFTSGSTGVPKGVMLSRGNLTSFVEAFFDRYDVSSSDRFLQCFDLTFDLSIMSYLIPLLCGACVYTVPYESVKYLYIGQLIEEQRITFALMAPSVIKLLRPYFGEIDCTSLRYSLFCGEALPLDATCEWAQCASNAVVENVYGPTEDTIFCSAYRYDITDDGSRNKTHNGVISIGKPIMGCAMEVFGEGDRPCKDGESGELCLSGNQLSKGYLNNEEKNRSAFFVKDGIRWYRTGDVCYRDCDGDFMYCGRQDQQAKIQGFRVELGEIEFNARTFLKDRNVVCLAFDNAQGLTEIAMFIESEPFDADALLFYLKSRMPSYMIPSRILFATPFPLNKSEKVDRNELRKLIGK